MTQFQISIMTTFISDLCDYIYMTSPIIIISSYQCFLCQKLLFCFLDQCSQCPPGNDHWHQYQEIFSRLSSLEKCREARQETLRRGWNLRKLDPCNIDNQWVTMTINININGAGSLQHWQSISMIPATFFLQWDTITMTININDNGKAKILASLLL